MPLPRTTPEQRGHFYDDTESLISPGFLTHPVTIAGTRFSIRSLSSGDLFLLRARVGLGTDAQWKDWAIATSIWILDGYVLLGEAHAVPRVYQIVRELPRPVKDVLFSLVLGLFNRQGKAIRAAEAYCYEAVARYKWKACGGRLRPPGLPGAKTLGVTPVQEMWTAFNVAEDLHQQDEAMWGGFKLVTSASSPKGIKKIDAADQQRHRSEEERRHAIMDRFYYTRMGVLLDDGKPKANSQEAQVLGPKSPDDLAEEMRKWVTGEEDWHDRVVTEYKTRVSNAYAQSKVEQEERQRVLERIRQEQQGDQQTLTPMIAYTPEQLQALLRDRDPGRAAGVRWVAGGQHPRDHIYEKFLERAPDAGNLQVQDGKLVVAENRDLTEQVDDRQVVFHPGPVSEQG